MAKKEKTNRSKPIKQPTKPFLFPKDGIVIQAVDIKEARKKYNELKKKK